MPSRASYPTEHFEIFGKSQNPPFLNYVKTYFEALKWGKEMFVRVANPSGAKETFQTRLDQTGVAQLATKLIQLGMECDVNC